MIAPLLVVLSLGAIAPADEVALERKAASALEVWDIDAAAAAADELAQKGASSVDAQEVIAMVRFQQGRYGEAVDIVKELEDKHGVKPDDTSELMVETAIQTKDFVAKKGEHFTVKYRPGPDEVLADWALETLEAQRAALLHDYGWVPPENVPVEIYPDADGFATVTTLSRKEIQTTGTIALCKFNKLMVTTPGALAFGYPWRDTLAHEYTHYVMARITKNKMPIWLHEGLAKYQEVRWRRDRGGEPSPTTQTVLAEAMAKKYFITFQRMHPSIAKLPTAFDATLAFAEVESLMGFCVDNWGYEGIQKLLLGLAADKPMDVALLDSFGVGLDGLQQKWQAWLAAHPPKEFPDLEIMETALKDPKADADASGAAHAGLTDDASNFLHLGDLLAGEERPDAAIVEYKKAHDSEKTAKSGHGGSGPIFDFKIGYTQLLAHRLDEAKTTLAPVLDTYPTYAPALKAMGEIELDHGDPKKARADFEASLWQAPFDPGTYAGLAQACEKTGDAACVKLAKTKYGLLAGMMQADAAPPGGQAPNHDEGTKNP